MMCSKSQTFLLFLIFECICAVSAFTLSMYVKIQCFLYCLWTQNGLKIDGNFTLSTNAILVTDLSLGDLVCCLSVCR